MNRRNVSLLVLPFFVFSLFSCSPASSREAQEDSGSSCPDTIPDDMSCIPGGTFRLGSEKTDWKKENWDLYGFKPHTVKLSTFLIDKTEVTTEDYQNCVKAGKCDPTVSNYTHLREPKQPQLKATWYAARKYCQVQGKRLPTEAEFEAASRGPDGEEFPWGNAPATCERAVIKDETGRGCKGHKAPGWHPTPASRKETGATWDVASKPVGRYGLYDMSGNAQEWVSDWFAPTLEACGEGCTGRDPQGPCNGADHCPGFEEKIVKGGSWYWGPIAARAASRRPHYPANRPIHHFGFRCAKSVTPVNRGE